MTIAIPNAKQPSPTLLCGGQPTTAQLDQARDAGYALIINLRPQSELEACGIDEAEEVMTRGMRYVQLPIGGPADLTREAATLLDEALASAPDKPVMIHCASGNRVGALLALRAGWLQDATPAQALKLGQDAGLTSLQALVAQRLGA